MTILKLVKEPKAKTAAKPAPKAEKPPRTPKLAKPEPAAAPAPVPVAAPEVTVKVRKPRAPLSEEQKTVLRERLVVAREARATKRAATVAA